MELTKLHDPKNGQMQVAGLMSGSGSNIRKIIEYEKQLEREQGTSPYHLAVIFSDSYNSNATEIGKDHDIPVITRDIKGFYSTRGKPRRDLELRVEFDTETVKALAPFEATVAAYGGYMSIATAPLMEAFLGVNVHPADLSILEEGKRKYTGSNAVRDAILAGEEYLRSTTHLIEEEVDGGRILMVSKPHQVAKGENFDPNDKELVMKVADDNQNALKKIGDLVIFPRTLQFLADGRYLKNSKGVLFFDEPIPQGVRL